jgi:Rrf2 family iron-sulfur cluster assembly transcriptional regulator
MRLTAQEEYGLRCLLQMARNEQGALTIREISEREGMSAAYVGKLLRILRQAGLVVSTRGQKGGYQLARPSEQITLAEVLTALGGPLYASDFCDHHTGERKTCVNTVDCSIRSLWAGVAFRLERLFAGVRLKDLACSERAMGHFVEQKLPETPILPRPASLPRL